ncbi:MAG TPA: TRAM domain-containing protein [Mycobacteriales bacterium]|nr:TRAM domain-containing protein [Mycobacteriales bacterium]
MILTVGRVAAGGACVARAEDGRVVFVRHCLPGETVRVVVTSEGSKFLRADTVEVLEPSPDRVTAPCPYAGTCGGCDWQHASESAQLALKTELVREHLRRLAGHEWDGTVEPVEPRWGWRTRVQWSVGPGGSVGLHPHRSRDVLEVEQCLIAAAAPPQSGEPGTSIEVLAVQGQHVTTVDGRRSDGPGVRVAVAGRRFEVAAGGFWQVHERAPEVLWEAVLSGLQPRPGDRVVDLYAGAGLFTALLASVVGPTGSVLAVEASARACADAARNTDDQPWVRVRTAAVTPVLVRGLRADLVVLDPPRAGAGLDVSAALAALPLRAVAYVSCDAATCARDLRVFRDAGWEVASVRVFDLYPQTEHVELVVVLRRG